MGSKGFGVTRAEEDLLLFDFLSLTLSGELMILLRLHKHKYVRRDKETFG